MAKMDWEGKRARDKRQLLKQAARDLKPRRSEPTTPVAKYPGRCFSCPHPIRPGDQIALITTKGVPHWRHATCALPSGPGKTAGPTRR